MFYFFYYNQNDRCMQVYVKMWMNEIAFVVVLHSCLLFPVADDCWIKNNWYDWLIGV